MSDPLRGISTVDLENRIEALMDQIGPPDAYGNTSFGVNVATWTALVDSVNEYLRINRNARR